MKEERVDRRRVKMYRTCWLVGWLVGLGSTAVSVLFSIWTVLVFQSISDCLPERRRKKREKTDERKMSKQIPLISSAGAVGPCRSIINQKDASSPEVHPASSHYPTTPDELTLPAQLGQLKTIYKVERDFCKFICGAPKTSQGYGIEQNSI